MDKKTSEGITAVTRPGELQYIVEEENMFVVGYFSNLDSEEYKVGLLEYDINLDINIWRSCHLAPTISFLKAPTSTRAFTLSH